MYIVRLFLISTDITYVVIILLCIVCFCMFACLFVLLQTSTDSGTIKDLKITPTSLTKGEPFQADITFFLSK